MTVTITLSTNTRYKVFSSSNTTLATAISEVINELEEHNIPMSNTKFTLTNGGEATPVFTLLAICKLH